MELSKFVENAPGKIVEIDAPRHPWAFLPHEMPPVWEFDNDLWPLLAEAKEALGTLNGIGQTLPDPQLLLRPLQNREAITSSSMEGTFVTAEELLLFELAPRDAKSTTDRTADWIEVFNYGRALQHGCELLESLPFCNRVIREIHKILMRGVRGRNKAPGDFRSWQVQIGSNARFMPPPHEEIPRLMTNLESCINAESAYDPLVVSFLVHYQFETIHPFGDGNGRVGRVLLSLMIYKLLGHSMPWLYLSAFFERYREEYVEKLFNISARGEWSEWVEFCLRATIEQAADSIRRCSEFNRVRQDFHDRLTSPSPRSHRLVDQLFQTPIVTIPSIAKQFDVVYHTAKKDIERLMDDEILVELSSSHPKSFYSREIMAIAYND